MRNYQHALGATITAQLCELFPLSPASVTSRLRHSPLALSTTRPGSEILCTHLAKVWEILRLLIAPSGVGEEGELAFPKCPPARAHTPLRFVPA